MKNILKAWSLFRIIRLLVGVIVIIWAVQTHTLIIGIFGAMIIVQAIVNTTCCDNNACATRKRD